VIGFMDKRNKISKKFQDALIYSFRRVFCGATRQISLRLITYTFNRNRLYEGSSLEVVSTPVFCL
jgi:hypothetical protein